MKQEGWFGIPSSFGKKVTNMVFILSLELARFACFNVMNGLVWSNHVQDLAGQKTSTTRKEPKRIRTWSTWTKSLKQGQLAGETIMSVDVTLLEECLLEHPEVDMVKYVDPRRQCKIFQCLQRDMIPNHGLHFLKLKHGSSKPKVCCFFPYMFFLRRFDNIWQGQKWFKDWVYYTVHSFNYWG